MNTETMTVFLVIGVIIIAGGAFFGGRKCMTCEGRGCARCGGRGKL